MSNFLEITKQRLCWKTQNEYILVCVRVFIASYSILRISTLQLIHTGHKIYQQPCELQSSSSSPLSPQELYLPCTRWWYEKFLINYARVYSPRNITCRKTGQETSHSQIGNLGTGMGQCMKKHSAHIINTKQQTSITLFHETKINEFVKQVSRGNLVSERLHSDMDGNAVLFIIYVKCGFSRYTLLRDPFSIREKINKWDESLLRIWKKVSMRWLFSFCREERNKQPVCSFSDLQL